MQYHLPANVTTKSKRGRQTVFDMVSEINSSCGVGVDHLIANEGINGY